MNKKRERRVGFTESEVYVAIDDLEHAGNISVVRPINLDYYGLLVLITAYLMPVMAAFADTTMHLIRNAIFFACKNPVKLIIILFFDVFPLYLTYTDIQMQPFYAFLWFVFGFGAQAMIVSSLLVKDFAKYLPKVDEYGAVIDEEEKGTGNGSGGKKSEQEILSEMQKLGM